MTSGTPAPLISTGHDRRALGVALAARVAQAPPRLLGFGEPMHGEEEFPLVRNALFEALVDRAGFVTIALETSAWHGRLVDDHVRGGAGDEDEVMAAGFTHGWGASPANRALVRWLRERNRNRPGGARVRFAGFDAPVEMAGAPSPRAALRVLHDFVRAHVDGSEPVPWEVVDRLLGDDARWEEPAAAMEPARSVGAEPRVHELRGIVDDLRWALVCALPGLRREHSDALDDALLAGRTSAGVLAYHAAMARDTDDRWQRLAAIRDAMMAENLQAIAEHGPVLVFAHNQHLRTGAPEVAFGTTTLRWEPAGAHLADRLGGDYQVIACAVGEAAHRDIGAPAPDTVEGVLHGLPEGRHLLSAPELRALGGAMRSPGFNYFPLDDALLGDVDQVLFFRTITAGGAG
ncbi:erythromycin esterase family protein [Actinosynnema sp. NPDC023587]|uniref:erythromycin esterase family protein n=1 Tax=Actinosynnema sp. NPDC023587 TaxID=3154695 RepID=UPI0033C2EFE3